MAASRKPRSTSKPIGEALEGLIKDLGIEPKLREYEAVLRWEEAVGAHIAKIATAEKSEVLRVGVLLHDPQTAGLIPLLPYLLGLGSASLPAAVALTAVALFAVGATLSLFTGRSALVSGLRMLAIGAAAGGVTYLVGKLLGVSLI